MRSFKHSSQPRKWESLDYGKAAVPSKSVKAYVEFFKESKCKYSLEFAQNNNEEQTTSSSDESAMNSHKVSQQIRSDANIKVSCKQNQIGIFKKLPLEILHLLLENLESSTDVLNCLLVCKSWAPIAASKLWYRIAVTNVQQYELLIRTVDQPDDSLMFPYKKYLKRLNLSSLEHVVDSSNLTAFMGCNRIERLTLANCSEVTDLILETICANNKNITAIDLGSLPLLTDKTLDALSNSNRKLQGINLHFSCYIKEESFIRLAERCRDLRRIRLSSASNVSDAVLISLAKNCPHLLELDLEGCSEISDVSIRLVLDNCKELRELRLGQCKRLTDAAFRNLQAGQLISMRILDLTGCCQITDDTVASIAKAATKLRNLVLAKCSKITDNGIIFLVQLSKFLHFLHLAHCEYLTDRGVMTIAYYCTRLRYIDVACCYQLTDDSMLYLAKLPKLRRIGLVKCSRITDVSIFAFARDCSATLERAHLSYCGNISLYALHVLLYSCKNLNHISLTGIHAFLRPDLQQFCRPTPRDFSASQEAIFCVFSGEGVKNLNQYLISLWKKATEESNQTEH